MTYLLTLLALTSTPAEASDSLSLPCSWEDGQTWTYRQVKTSETGVPNPLHNHVQTYTLRVTANPGGFVFHSTVDTITGPNGDQLTAAFKEALTPYKDIGTDLEFSEGRFTTVRNLKQVKPQVIASLKAMMATGVPDEVMNQVNSILSSPETATPMLAKEPQLLFPFHCMKGTAGQVTQNKRQEPSALGIDIPLNYKATITAVSDASHTAELESVLSLDEEGFKAILPQIFAKFVPGGMEIPEAMQEQLLAQLPPLNNDTTITATYDTRDGFPNTVRVENIAGKPGSEMYAKEVTTFERVTK